MKYVKKVSFIGALLVSAFSFAYFSNAEILSLEPITFSDLFTNIDGSGPSSGTAISADGQYVAFESSATNLVDGDTNRSTDVFVYDLNADTIERVSIDDLGGESNDESEFPSISSDGRYVAFDSQATNLVPDDTNDSKDIFVYDRNTDTIERVSVDDMGVEANGDSSQASISNDGRYVAFQSSATNLVVGDTNDSADVFVYDRNTDTIERVSVDSLGVEGNNLSNVASISADGRYVSFRSSATNLVAGDTNGVRDIFVYDRNTDTIERVSVDDLGNEGDDNCSTSALSANGRYVAFDSDATNLVVGDTNSTTDVFVYDRNTDTIERVSVDDMGTEGDDQSQLPSISSDGRYVAFNSISQSFLNGSGTKNGDVYVYDRNTDTLQLISIDDLGDPGDDFSGTPSISADGQLVAFSSPATNFDDSDVSGQEDVFVVDMGGGSMRRLSIYPDGIGGNSDSRDSSVASDSPNIVVFQSQASNLVPGDTNDEIDIFVYDRNTDTIERVSVNDFGNETDSTSDRSSISSDGRYVAFTSEATNLVSDDTNDSTDMFVYDRNTSTIERVSVDNLGVEGNDRVNQGFISGNGRFVTFVSSANNLVPGDTNAASDVFVYDRDIDTVERVSVDDNGVEADSSSYQVAISEDGTQVVFLSSATNLVPDDTNGVDDIFVYDRNINTIERVSVDSLGVEGNDSSTDPAISADGRFVAFSSNSSNLVTGDTNGQADVFVHDRETDTTERVSVGALGVEGNGGAYTPSISSSGQFIAFASDSDNLVADDTNATSDVFVYDRDIDTIERISVDSVGEGGDGSSSEPYISSDGQHVSFTSSADNFAEGRTNGFDDIFFVTRAVPEEDDEEPAPHSSGGSSRVKPKPIISLPIIPTENTCHIFTTFMKKGSKYGEVPLLQTKLNGLGFNSGIADGLFGPITDGAVKAFQKAKNLIVDGLVGPQTRGVLNSICDDTPGI